MKTTFDLVIEELLESEGGYVDHPKDPGGATNLGITLGTAIANKLDLDQDGDVDKNDVRLVTIDIASDVYRKKYWNKVRGDDLPAGLDYSVFDFGVNSGPARAVKALQKLLGVSEDGIIGPNTLAEINSRKDVDTLINRYNDDRITFLKGLGTFKTFGNGWTARVDRVRKLSLTLAEKPKPSVRNSEGGINWSALVPILITILTAVFGWLQSRK